MLTAAHGIVSGSIYGFEGAYSPVNIIKRSILNGVFAFTGVAALGSFPLFLASSGVSIATANIATAIIFGPSLTLAATLQLYDTFQNGTDVDRKFFALDLLIGGFLISPRTKALTQTVFHATDDAAKAQSILDGIDPKFLNSESRFGKGFYLTEKQGTGVLELEHHDVQAAFSLRYNLNQSKAKILDLTDTNVASQWGYSGGDITSATKAIGSKAKSQGFNAIRFRSERGPGNNVVVIDQFKELLDPRFITPVQ